MARKFDQYDPVDENYERKEDANGLDPESSRLIPKIDTNIQTDSSEIRAGHPTADEPSDDEPSDPGQDETGIPGIGDFAPQDTRFGGEDISGMSEWSMRARMLELDDGLDAGDYKRPDNEIAIDLADALERELRGPGELSFKVSGGEITVEGWLAGKEQIDNLETIALNVPGVKEVHNLVEVSDRSGR